MDTVKLQDGRKVDVEDYLAAVVAVHQETPVPSTIITTDYWLGPRCLVICKQIEQDTGVLVLLSINNGTRTKFAELVAAFEVERQRRRSWQ